MRPAPVDAVEAGKGLASVVQQELEHGQVLHAEHVEGGEGGGVRGDAGVDVGAVLHQQGDGPDAALPRRHHDCWEHVQVWVGPSCQQHLHRLDVAVADGEVERRAAAVLVQPGALLRQLSVDVEARLDQQLQNLIAVVLSSEVQRADARPPHSGLTGDPDQGGHDPGKTEGPRFGPTRNSSNTRAQRRQPAAPTCHFLSGLRRAAVITPSFQAC